MHEELARAAALILEGKLVAFPTETVYGLGANALDAVAVQRVFQVKGRPPESPLIVHVDSVDMARGLVAEWPAHAEKLATRFWPGPLTLVLPKRSCIPDIVTAGLPTVGVRMPAHPLALGLIRAAGVPLAGPSANRFGGVSPTRAEHVRQAVGDSVDLILDGGPTELGIESTVISLAVSPPCLLRLGMVSRADLETLIGHVEVARRVEDWEKVAHPSPGMHRRHYSPRTRLVLIGDGTALPPGRGAYLWMERPSNSARSILMPSDPADYAAVLYSILHRMDDEGWDWIAVEAPPDLPKWAAIADRLWRAASG